MKYNYNIVIAIIFVVLFSFIMGMAHSAYKRHILMLYKQKTWALLNLGNYSESYDRFITSIKKDNTDVELEIGAGLSALRKFHKRDDDKIIDGFRRVPSEAHIHFSRALSKSRKSGQYNGTMKRVKEIYSNSVPPLFDMTLSEAKKHPDLQLRFSNINDEEETQSTLKIKYTLKILKGEYYIIIPNEIILISTTNSTDCSDDQNDSTENDDETNDNDDCDSLKRDHGNDDNKESDNVDDDSPDPDEPDGPEEPKEYQRLMMYLEEDKVTLKDVMEFLSELFGTDQEDTDSGIMNAICLDYELQPPDDKSFETALVKDYDNYTDNINESHEDLDISTDYTCNKRFELIAIRLLLHIGKEMEPVSKQAAVNAIRGESFHEYKDILLDTYIDFVKEKEPETYELLGEKFLKKDIAKRDDFITAYTRVGEDVFALLVMGKTLSEKYGLDRSCWDRAIKSWNE